MVSRKYVSDYRLEEQIDETGRTAIKTIYIGDYYVLTPNIQKKDKKIIVFASVAAWFAYVGTLFTKTEAMHIIYVILPFIGVAFPMLYMSITAITLHNAKEKIERQSADKITQRLPANALISIILPATSTTAFIIYILITRTKINTGDILYAILSVTTASCAVLIYMKTRHIKSRKIGSAEEKETKQKG